VEDEEKLKVLGELVATESIPDDFRLQLSEDEYGIRETVTVNVEEGRALNPN